ncbi:MAG TPA: hypothetical protein VGH04_08095, partial [Gemmatimonadaceae bacterium]
MTRIVHRQIRRRATSIIAAAAFVTLAGPLGAQQKAVQSGTASALDRTKIPSAAKSADLRVPSWTKVTLTDGAELVVSEKHDLPLVSFTINFVGGAAQYDPAGKTGLGSIVVQMLTEGTSHRTGDQISND